jgi:RNA ligase (TIGR02306 family)
MEGEEIVVTEKIDGTNVRLGLIDGELMAGSHAVRRKRPNDTLTLEKHFPGDKENLYWWPFKQYKIKELLEYVSGDSEDFTASSAVIVFGEIYGSGIQSYHYGLENGKKEFRAFDIFTGTRYLDYEEFEKMCKKFDIPMVPILYRGHYSFEKVNELAQGNTTIEGANHIREGVVFKPVKERWCEKTGRVILKHKSDAYELDQKRGDGH